MPVNVDKWTVFSLLEQEFLERVKLACVFGSSGNEALILTDDDQVFAIGSNCSGCLGVGDTVSGLEPRRVDILCGKKVKKIGTKKIFYFKIFIKIVKSHLLSTTVSFSAIFF